MEKTEDFNKDDLFKRAKDYIDTNIELKKLTIIQSVAKTIGGVVSGLVLVVIAVFFLIFLSVAVGLYLGELLASMYLGFFIVAFFYLLIGFIVAMMRKSYIQNPIVDKLIRKILKMGK